eukprot:3154386-Prymnesium_polylepis.1
MQSEIERGFPSARPFSISRLPPRGALLTPLRSSLPMEQRMQVSSFRPCPFLPILQSADVRPRLSSGACLKVLRRVSD